ncbi:MAG: hypothetical protein U9O94_00155 [Nanoarchaeota archaeon]|nr:hypothetical protein [Nanoarchaeota archaeon]
MKIRKYYDKTGAQREEFILTRKEQELWYDECLSEVLTNTRAILDNLEFIREFKVNWQDYHKKGVKTPKGL